MAEKPPLYIDYHAGKIEGPLEVIGRLFATPKDKSWGYAPPVATIVISNPERLRQVAARLRKLGYPLVETPSQPSGTPASPPDR